LYVLSPFSSVLSFSVFWCPSLPFSPIAIDADEGAALSAIVGLARSHTSFLAGRMRICAPASLLVQPIQSGRADARPEHNPILNMGRRCFSRSANSSAVAALEDIMSALEV
jgi:hypothetical protein